MHSPDPSIAVGPLMTQEMADEHDAASADNLRNVSLLIEEAMDQGGEYVKIKRNIAEVARRALGDYADLVELGWRR